MRAEPRHSSTNNNGPDYIDNCVLKVCPACQRVRDSRRESCQRLFLFRAAVFAQRTVQHLQLSVQLPSGHVVAALLPGRPRPAGGRGGAPAGPGETSVPAGRFTSELILVDGRETFYNVFFSPLRRWVL